MSFTGKETVLYLQSIAEAIKYKRRVNAASTGKSEKQVDLEKEYKDLLYSENFATHSLKLLELRKLILLKGLPDCSNSIISDESELPDLRVGSDQSSSTDGEHTTDESPGHGHKNSLRTSIWKLLLGVSFSFKPEVYRIKVEIGPTDYNEKIENDSFRTFKKNDEFWNKVDLSGTRKTTVLDRVLNAIAVDHGYVQGMNVLLAPFIFTMHEIDSYYCFKALITNHCPQYISKNLEGVCAGCRLFQRCLELLDPQLCAHIRRWLSDFETVVAMPPLMTLFANMQPLGEVLKVWDAIFAFGIHFNVLLLVVHVMLIRDDLLQVNNGYKIKKRMEEPLLDAELLVHCGLGMVQFIHAELFRELALHPMVNLPGQHTPRQTHTTGDISDVHSSPRHSLRRRSTAPHLSGESLNNHNNQLNFQSMDGYRGYRYNDRDRDLDGLERAHREMGYRDQPLPCPPVPIPVHRHELESMYHCVHNGANLPNRGMDVRHASNTEYTQSNTSDVSVAWTSGP